jgi:hypothetical protein
MTKQLCALIALLAMTGCATSDLEVSAYKRGVQDGMELARNAPGQCVEETAQ